MPNEQALFYFTYTTWSNPASPILTEWLCLLEKSCCIQKNSPQTAQATGYHLENHSL